jgi:hypothetical protein
MPGKKDDKQTYNIYNKGGVGHLLLSRGHCIAFWSSVPPLQVAPSCPCSVASLRRFPGHQLPGSLSLHWKILTDYLLGWGRPSTCSTGHAEFQSTSSPSPHRATGDWVLPAKWKENCKVDVRMEYGHQVYIWRRHVWSHTVMTGSHQRGVLFLYICSYLLGLLAMIKCSICSYQCDNWYVSNWRLACHINCSLGRCPLELAQGPSRVALAWHNAGSSTPFGVTR